MLKSFGLVLKMVGEPLWCIVADMTDDKVIFAFSLVMNIVTMEILRLAQPLTFGIICCVKLLRTTTAPGNTLMTTASFKLTEGSSEGYGQQRMFGSLAWGKLFLFQDVCFIDWHFTSHTYAYSLIYHDFYTLGGMYCRSGSSHRGLSN